MFCIWCGAEVGEDDCWCMECGKPLRDEDINALIESGAGEVLLPTVPHDVGSTLETPSAAPAPAALAQSVPDSHREARTAKGVSRKTLIAAIASVAIVALIACIALVVMPRIGDPDNRSDDPQATSAPHEQSAADEQTDDEHGDDGQDAGEGTGVPVRASLGEYSWEELSAIADEIEECSSRTDAIAVAARYNLVGADGTMYAQTIDLVMTDGTTIKMRIVDVYHDETSDGSRAGLTFMATNIAYQHRMAPGRTTDGGWESSEVRQWLATTVWDTLPTEVAEAIVPVRKLSNNKGKTTTTSSVTATTDYLWVPSIVELCGPVDWTFDSDPTNSGFYCSVFNSEGSQYAAFAQAGIHTEDPNGILALGQAWWMRSTAASSGRGRYVSGDGNPSDFGNSSDSHGIVFGFCL